MNSDSNALNWFEIPVTDMDRAKAFYETVFGIQMQTMEMEGNTMAMFPYQPGSGRVSGALIKGEWYKPGGDAGPLVYLNGDPDLATPLSKVESAGGEVVLDKMQISEDVGYMAIFMDPEGNRVALHSNG